MNIALPRFTLAEGDDRCENGLRLHMPMHIIYEILNYQYQAVGDGFEDGLRLRIKPLVNQLSCNRNLDVCQDS
jgi:hypothetical protein